jgi:hypothetical protein
MAEMPAETRQKIGEGIRKAFASPAARKRLRDSWTPARRTKISHNRRDFFAALRADPVKAAEHAAKISAGRRAAQERRQAAEF